MKSLVKLSLISLLSLGIAYGTYTLTTEDLAIVNYANLKIDSMIEAQPKNESFLRKEIKKNTTGNFSERIKTVFGKIFERRNRENISDALENIEYNNAYIHICSSSQGEIYKLSAYCGDECSRKKYFDTHEIFLGESSSQHSLTRPPKASDSSKSGKIPEEIKGCVEFCKDIESCKSKFENIGQKTENGVEF